MPINFTMITNQLSEALTVVPCALMYFLLATNQRLIHLDERANTTAAATRTFIQPRGRENGGLHGYGTS